MKKKPFLAMLAFFPWALGASPAIAGLTGLPADETTTILMAAVLIIPLIDTLFDR